MDIIRYYLLPNSITLKLSKQKYEYTAVKKKIHSDTYLYFIVGYRFPRSFSFLITTAPRTRKKNKGFM